jgi:hypothetical protein
MLPPCATTSFPSAVPIFHVYNPTWELCPNIVQCFTIILMFTTAVLPESVFGICKQGESCHVMVSMIFKIIMKVIFCCFAAGQERFRTITSSYYRGAQGIILGNNNSWVVLISYIFCCPNLKSNNNIRHSRYAKELDWSKSLVLDDLNQQWAKGYTLLSNWTIFYSFWWMIFLYICMDNIFSREYLICSCYHHSMN